MAPWAGYTMDKLQALRLPNPRVRRRLFDEDHNNQDNLDNILQETRLRDKNNMKEKWNFDFDNEEPLDGKYQWYKLDKETWVSVDPKSQFKPVTVFDDKFKPVTVLKDSFEKENQVTPRINKAEIPPDVRKRKLDIEMANVTDRGAKRKINFD